MKADTLLPRTWEMPEGIRNRLGREPGPQRAMLEDGHLLIILHELPGPDEHHRRAALFWRKPDGSWSSNQQRGGLAALGAHMKAFEDKLHALEDTENRAATAAEYHVVLESLAPVLRSARGLHRALQQAREMIKGDRDLINLRDQAAAVERSAELLLQDAEFGLNFTVARQAEAQAASARQMARTAHRLNLLAAFFLPVTALASLFGMDFEAGAASRPAWFLGVCVLGLGLGLALTLTLARRT